MEYDLVRADPAGNITILVLNPVEDPAERASLVKALLEDRRLGAEQVGFVRPPEEPGGLWRLEMMGGEFCGNAARSFGLWVARRQGMTGKRTQSIGISGTSRSLPVLVDLDTGEAEAAMPLPLAVEALDWEGRSLPVLIFEGIVHVIVEEGPGFDQAAFPAIRRRFEERFPFRNALGLLCYDPARSFLEPWVFVYGSGSLVRESSCGSGTAALAYWLHLPKEGSLGHYPIAQPGGLIEATVRKEEGRITRLSIGGKVRLGDPEKFLLPLKHRAVIPCREEDLLGGQGSGLDSEGETGPGKGRVSRDPEVDTLEASGQGALVVPLQSP
jgi:diaminopimelate epimerase